MIEIRIPPLRERRADIMALASAALSSAAQRYRKELREFDVDAIDALRNYSWPGNVRELRNMVERLMLLATDRQVGLTTVEIALPKGGGIGVAAASAFSSGALAERVDAFEREVILAELKRSHSNVSLAAKSLGLERSHLYKKAEQLGIDLRAMRREQGSQE